jgi:hypothetical protein
MFVQELVWTKEAFSAALVRRAPFRNEKGAESAPFGLQK